MAENKEYQATLDDLKKFGQKRLSLEEKKKRRRALHHLGLPGFDDFLRQRNIPLLKRDTVTTLQVNIGLYCNQACTHCHVEASPLRKADMMTPDIAARLIEVLDNTPTVTTLDITGGAPEMNPVFRTLVKEGRARNLDVIDRCNLTVLLEPGQEDLSAFLAAHQVHVIASLPCYSQKNVDSQRGRKVFERSIQALQELNGKGYGRPGTSLVLDLVYNPGGAFLPPDQATLEARYREELERDYGIVFNRLYCMTNMPIKRFADFLYKQGKLGEYMELLVNNFNPTTVDTVMCKSLVSVRWDGRLHDCDFNLALDMDLLPADGAPSQSDEADRPLPRSVLSSPPPSSTTLWDISSLNDLVNRRIASDTHCFGCTAGAGSS